MPHTIEERVDPTPALALHGSTAQVETSSHPFETEIRKYLDDLRSRRGQRSDKAAQLALYDLDKRP